MSQTLPQTLEIEVSHVTSKDDFIALAEVEAKAFGPGELTSIMFPPSSTINEQSEEANFSARFHQKTWSTDPTARYLKAALPGGKIIGLARWRFFLDGLEPPSPWYLETSGLPPNTNQPFCKYFFEALDKARKDAMKGKEHFLLEILCVLPECQRMGVGVKLLEWGLSEADRQGRECWIDASPSGLGLYKKFGWKEVGVLDVDLGRWGGEQGKVARTVHMVRAPQVKAE